MFINHRSSRNSISRGSQISDTQCKWKVIAAVKTVPLLVQIIVASLISQIQPFMPELYLYLCQWIVDERDLVLWWDMFFLVKTNRYGDEINVLLFFRLSSYFVYCSFLLLLRERKEENENKDICLLSNRYCQCSHENIYAQTVSNFDRHTVFTYTQEMPI